MSDSDFNQGPKEKSLDYASCAVQGHANLTYCKRQTAPDTEDSVESCLNALQQPVWLSITQFITEGMT